MADLKLTADFTDIQTLKRELLDIPKKARDSARTFEAEYARVERALVKQARQFQNNAAESQKYYSQLLKLGGEAKSAERSAEVFTKALERQEQVAQRVGKVFRDQTSQAVRSLAKEFARSGNQSAYLSGINKIVKAQSMLQTGSRMSRSEIMRLGTEFRQQAKFANELAVAQARAGVAAQGSARHMNRMGVVTQQAGYQIGDFLVQVQSGTNPLVAFGQQATQLAGVMTLFGGKFILLGSILGIAIPLVTAIGAAFMRTRGEAEETSTAFERMSSALDDIESLAAPVGTSVQGSLRGINSAAQVTLQLFRDIASEQLAMARNEFLGQTGIRQGTRAFDQSVMTQFTSEAMSGVGRTMADIATSMSEDFKIMGLTVDQAREFDRLLQSVSGTTRGEMAQSFAEVVEQMDAAGLITDETKKLIEQMGTELGLVKALQDGIVGSSEKATEAYKELVELAREFQDTQLSVSSDLYQRLSSLVQETRLQKEIARYGSESAQVAELRAVQEREAVRLEAMKAGHFGESLKAILAQYDAMVKAREEAESTESAISNINKISMGSVIAQVANLASVLNITKEEAMALAGVLPAALTRERAIAQAGTSGGRGSAGMPIPGQFGLQSTAYPNAGQIAQGLLDKEAGKDKGPDAVERLQQEIAFRQRTLNLSKEEKALQTEIFRITNALGKDRNKYSSDFIANLAQQNLAIQEQERVIEEARKQQEQLADSIANSFGDAFMSIVDGTKSTKDAFKQMAAAIVRDLYQVYVMKRLIGSAEAGTGIAGAIGRLIGGKESGGTMMAGRPYIVGERGPELVIPGRSSTVTNADLTRKSMGGSDAVVVNNNINVTGGTDPAAIRQEVAKLMPTITNATKTAVIDARRRGGQMRAAFQ